MSVFTLSPIEQIAQDIEDWGDGWRFMGSPDDRGRRARLLRWHDDEQKIRIEIEIALDGAYSYVHIKCSVRMTDGHWENVSVSVRNAATRKALDEINRRLDVLDQTPEMGDE